MVHAKNYETVSIHLLKLCRKNRGLFFSEHGVVSSLDVKTANSNEY